MDELREPTRAEAEAEAKNLWALGEAGWKQLHRAVLEYLPADRKVRRVAMTREPQFAHYAPRVLNEMVAAMRATGEIEKSGGRFDAAYQLTPQGVMARDMERQADAATEQA